MGTQSFRTIHQIIETARARLDQTYWDYLIGGGETETTLKRNRLALDSLALKPRVLNDVSEVDTTATFLGEELKIPCLLAPLGAMEEFDDGGAASAAIAAAQAGVMSIKSSVCEPDLEIVAAASDAPKMYQLYARGDAEWVDHIVKRVVASGYKAFCLTVDTAVVSRRERDIARGVVPTSAVTPEELIHQAKLCWDDVKRIRDKCDIPVALKGIQCVEDTAIALEHGVDIIYVSNHGGRQLDHGRGAIDLLPDIVAEVDGKASVVVDGGFYRGTDIVKAMALGADAVGLGRLQAWALAAGGVPVLVDCLTILGEELQNALALCGVNRFADLNPSCVTSAQPVTEPSVFSAFPLLDLENKGL
jgi:isopentenyl diphosphate isomerase/L-lactate dehydrogenase-like FMN-dependent dehydrogenase